MRGALVATSLVWTHALAAQENVRVIRGVVSDSLGRPIAFANVQTTGQSRTVTDDSGQFTFRAPPSGEISLRIYRLGYEPRIVRFAPAVDTSVHVRLTAIPRLLEATQVSAERTSRRLDVNGFYGRMNDRHKGLGSGWFFTQDDIALRNPMRISQVLDDVPGVRVARVKDPNGTYEWLFRGPNGCEFSIYVDGNRIHPPLTESRRQKNPLFIDMVLSPTATGGIEVYPRGSGAPPKFQMLNGTCGVAIFWSR